MRYRLRRYALTINIRTIFNNCAHPSTSPPSYFSKVDSPFINQPSPGHYHKPCLRPPQNHRSCGTGLSYRVGSDLALTKTTPRSPQRAVFQDRIVHLFLLPRQKYGEASDESNSINYWIQEGKWPRQYSEQDPREHVKYYRYPIYTYSFTTLEGKEKWTAYRFTKNVYTLWMPTHFKRICSAIDQRPSHLDFEVASLAGTGLSQEIQSHHLSQSDTGSSREEDGQLPGIADPRESTLDTSIAGSGTAKKQKRSKE